MPGVDPINAYQIMLKGAFGSIRGIGDTLVKTTSLLLVGLAVQWRLSAEFGTLVQKDSCTGCTWWDFGRYHSNRSNTRLGISGCDGCWIWIWRFLWFDTAALKVKFGVNEIIVTVLANFVVLLFISYLLHGPIKAPGFNPYTPEIFPASQLPIIFPHTRLHAGIIIAARSSDCSLYPFMEN